MLAFPQAIPTGPDGPVSELAGKLEASLQHYFPGRPVGDRVGHERPGLHPTLPGPVAEDIPARRRPETARRRHYLQEDAHERIIPVLLHFLGPTATPATTRECHLTVQVLIREEPAQNTAQTHESAYVLGDPATRRGQSRGGAQQKERVQLQPRSRIA